MKQTVEEAAKEYYERYKIHLAKDIFRPRIIDVFKSGAEWQAKQSPWISVEERLPEEGQKVFVLVMCYGTPCIQEEKFCRNSNLDKKGMWIHGNSIVLAWFPTPPLSMRYSKSTRMYLNGLKRKETEYRHAAQ